MFVNLTHGLTILQLMLRDYDLADFFLETKQRSHTTESMAYHEYKISIFESHTRKS